MNQSKCDKSFPLVSAIIVAFLFVTGLRAQEPASAAANTNRVNTGQRDVGAPRVGPVHPGFNPALPTLWLIGDSTVKNGRDTGGDGLWGWGKPIPAWFDKTKINVENQALGGTSSRSFLTTKLWEAVRIQIKPGDFVIMQFGHNDGGGSFNDGRSRKSISGSGDDTLEVTNSVAGGEKEIVRTYGWYLRKYIADTKARGGMAIVCSLIPRNDWTDGKIRRATNGYAKWAKEAAAAGGAPFIDLNRLVADRYDKLGEEAVKPFFPKEHTHTGWEGAVVNAECVVEGIKGLAECPLKNYLLPNPEPPQKP